MNHINLTVQRIGKQHYIKLSVREKSDRQKTISFNSETISGSNVKAYKSKVLTNYEGEILLKIASKNGKYLYHYSLDGGASYEKLAETADNILIGMMYTGANVGVYATSNGQKTSAYADFDWISYKGFVKR